MLRVLILTAAAACILAASSPVFADDLTDAIDKAKPEAEAFAKSAVKKMEADGVSGEVQSLIQRARENALKLDDKAGVPGGVDLNAMLKEYAPPAMQGPKKQTNRLMVFITTAMPEKSLMQLSDDVGRAGGVMVLRGLVNNSIKDTMPALQKVAKAGGPVVIDPTLFRDFGIEAVPTFVVATGEVPGCENRDCPRVMPENDRVLGDITLDAALETIVDGKGPAADVAADYRKRLGKGVQK